MSPNNVVVIVLGIRYTQVNKTNIDSVIMEFKNLKFQSNNSESR